MLDEVVKPSLVFEDFFRIRTAHGGERVLVSDQLAVKSWLHFLEATMRFQAIT